ncbi:hypothetical protein DSM104299_01382 [Baekduia alba]|uniref:hypothetical protein n=1 Tax=Baekduia alba TaxID=2997333 RepID=UPI002340E90B|nr:hypothetical protein [Baekduia alba]WCB92684.1 hypothetical protein DSM104299_01382 [Baekduia alba]
MPRRRAPVLTAATVLAAAVVAAGCDGPTPADLFLVQRDGDVPGAKLTLRLTDDGGAYCNETKRYELTSAQLITAREIRGELDGRKDEDVGLAEKHITLKPGSISTYNYKVRSENGSVAFADTSPHQPQTFYRLAQLTREVATQNCHLAR